MNFPGHLKITLFFSARAVCAFLMTKCQEHNLQLCLLLIERRHFTSIALAQQSLPKLSALLIVSAGFFKLA